MKHHPEIIQNEPEWEQMRAGKITMSALGCVMASARDFTVVKLSSKEFGVLNVATKTVYKKTYEKKEDAEKFATDQKKKYDSKEFSALAQQYAVNLAIEQITGEPVPSSYQNEHMKRGHEQEPFARSLYEKTAFESISPGGFYCSEIIGYSPDGLVRFNPDTKKYLGAIEILSCISSVHYDNVKRKSYYAPKKWQLIGALKYAELEFIDFVSYCYDYPAGKKIFIYRLKPENFQDEFKMIEERVSEFLELIEKTKLTILDSEYFL